MPELFSLFSRCRAIEGCRAPRYLLGGDQVKLTPVASIVGDSRIAHLAPRKSASGEET